MTCKALTQQQFVDLDRTVLLFYSDRFHAFSDLFNGSILLMIFLLFFFSFSLLF